MNDNIRIGHGYDIHRFEENSTKASIMLGGVRIPYERGLIAHSDGDVLIHAVCDALLGACGLGDIGQHFPDTDPAYKESDSRMLLRQVVQKIHAKDFQVGNVDITVIAEAPKLSPYMIEIKENIASDLQVFIEQVNVKATTNEKLDAIGNKLGIAVHAVALLRVFGMLENESID
jgi:2-C-methyl-D-erythritol 2,4-cyclodiphosphate synthase